MKEVYNVILGMLFLSQAATVEVVGFFTLGAICGSAVTRFFVWRWFGN